MLALAIAVAVGATGVLPTGDGARCLVMNKRVAIGHDCCPKCESPPVTAIGTPCCQIIHGRTLEARALAPVAQPRLAPAPLTAVLPRPASYALAETAAVRAVAALPRGRPPGERRAQLSTVLLI